MIKADSKRIRRGEGTSYSDVPRCKVLRFHTERIREAQESLPSYKEIAGLSGPHFPIAKTWQQMIIVALGKGALCTCDIASVIGLSIPATSHQLQHLHKQKLISYKISGKMVYYSLRAEDLSKIS